MEGSVAKTIFDEWLQALREAIFADELRDSRSRTFSTTSPSPASFCTSCRDLEASVPVRTNFLNGKSINQVQLEALQTALQNLTAKRGPAPALWGYIPPTINFLPLPPIPSSSRGTYIQAVELSKPIIRVLASCRRGRMRILNLRTSATSARWLATGNSSRCCTPTPSWNSKRSKQNSTQRRDRATRRTRHPRAPHYSSFLLPEAAAGKSLINNQ